MYKREDFSELNMLLSFGQCYKKIIYTISTAKFFMNKITYDLNYTMVVAVYCKWSGYSRVAIRKVAIVLPSGHSVVETTIFCLIRLQWPLLCKLRDWCTYFKQMNRDKSTHAKWVDVASQGPLPIRFFFRERNCQQRTQTITGTKKAQFPLSFKWLIVETREQLQIL